MKCVVAMYNASANGEYTLSIPSKQWDFQVGNVSVQINGCVTLFENIRNKWRDIYIYTFQPRNDLGLSRTNYGTMVFNQHAYVYQLRTSKLKQ